MCPSSTATAGVISVQHKGSFSRTLVSTDAQTTLKGSDIHAAASSATAEMLLRQELEEKLRSQTKELASEQRSANAMKKALASARDELAAAQELRRSDCDNLRRAQQAAKRDIKAAERMADEVKHAARADFEWRIGEMQAKMQAELREQLDALQISMEAEARRADAAEAERSRLYDKMEGIMRTREGLIDALAEAQRKREQVIVKRYTSRYSCVRSSTLPPCGPPGPRRALRVQTALREHWRGQPPASQQVASAVSLPAW